MLQWYLLCNILTEHSMNYFQIDIRQIQVSKINNKTLLCLINLNNIDR